MERLSLELLKEFLSVSFKTRVRVAEFLSYAISLNLFFVDLIFK